jgi:hypothetical protein
VVGKRIVVVELDLQLARAGHDDEGRLPDELAVGNADHVAHDAVRAFRRMREAAMRKQAPDDFLVGPVHLGQLVDERDDFRLELLDHARPQHT